MFPKFAFYRVLLVLCSATSRATSGSAGTHLPRAPEASHVTHEPRVERRTRPRTRDRARTHTNTHTHVQRSRATAQTYGRISPKRRKRPRLNPLSSPHIDLRGPLSRRSSTRLPRPQRAATAARSLASPSSRFSRHKPTPKKFK